MPAKDRMTAAIRAVKSANAAIKREMSAITLQDRMELLPDAQTKHELAVAIKALEATLKELRKY